MEAARLYFLIFILPAAAISSVIENDQVSVISSYFRLNGNILFCNPSQMKNKTKKYYFMTQDKTSSVYRNFDVSEIVNLLSKQGNVGVFVCMEHFEEAELLKLLNTTRENYRLNSVNWIFAYSFQLPILLYSGIQQKMFFLDINNGLLTEQYAINNVTTSQDIGIITKKQSHYIFNSIGEENFLIRRSNFQQLELNVLVEMHPPYLSIRQALGK